MIAADARSAIAARGRFAFAVSGGHTPWIMLRALATEDLPWAGVHVYQVDERSPRTGTPIETSPICAKACSRTPPFLRTKSTPCRWNPTIWSTRPPYMPLPSGRFSDRPPCWIWSTWVSARTGTPPRWSRETRCSR